MEVARLEDATAELAVDDCGEGAAGSGAPPVWVKYADGDVEEVEREVRTACGAAGLLQSALRRQRQLLQSSLAWPPVQIALISPIMRDLVLFDGAGSSHDAPVLLPKQVCACWWRLSMTAAPDARDSNGAGRTGDAELDYGVL